MHAWVASQPLDSTQVVYLLRADKSSRWQPWCLPDVVTRSACAQHYDLPQCHHRLGFGSSFFSPAVNKSVCCARSACCRQASRSWRKSCIWCSRSWSNVMNRSRSRSQPVFSWVPNRSRGLFSARPCERSLGIRSNSDGSILNSPFG